jgi:hypothetical protein
MSHVGLPEALFERLASSPAEPYLRQLVDLYLNLAAFEAHVFTLNAPEMFYSLLSPPRDPGKAIARLRRLDNELRFCSKLVSIAKLIVLLPPSSLLCTATQSLRFPERKPSNSLLQSNSSWPLGPSYPDH